MEIAGIVGLLAGSYVVYQALSYKFGNATDNSTMYNNMDFYGNDQNTVDLLEFMGPTKVIKIQKIAEDIYNVDNGTGVFYRMNKHGVDELVSEHKRSPAIKFI